MAPTRKSRGVNRKYIDEVSPSKDGDSAKRSNSRKRKSSDMLGPRWTLEELTRFYDAYRKYGKDWKKVAGAVRNRSPEMVEAIFTMNRAYLSLPHGTASSDGLIAMMTDHYSILGGSDGERESSDGAGPSQKIQKRVRRKAMHTDPKTPDDQFVSNTQILASDYGFLSSSKKKRSVGSRSCPVGKRTPRFPVSFSYENASGDTFVSPTRQGLKLSATANDDEVAHEIAKALADASLRGGSPQLSRTPSKILERVKSSPSMHAQRKHSLVEDLEGSIEADTDELSRNKSFMKGSLSTVTLRKKERKPEKKKFEVGNNNENYLDVKEECSGTEEEELYGTMRGMSKDTKISSHRQKKNSKRILLRKDEAPAIDALLTLADLSFMMPKEDKDDPVSSDSRVQFKDDDDEHIDELGSSRALAMHPPEEKHINSGVKLKVSRSEVVSSKTLRPGKESVKVSSVAEEDKDIHQSVSKTSRRKQRMSMSRIRKADAQPDSQPSESTEIEAGGAGKCKNKNSSHSGYDDGSDLRKEANDPIQSAAQVTGVNHASIPTKVWSRRKVHLKKSEAQKNVNFPDKISNERSSLPFSALHDRAFNFKEKLSSCLENPFLRRWCTHEWFYSAIDYPWFAKREFNEYLYHVGLSHMPRLTRVEWGVIRSSLGNPRRFSEQFLKEEKEKLNQYRDSVREHYNELREGVRKGLPNDLARPLSVGQRVIAIHPKTREIHDGSVLTVDYSRCRVQFDCHELGVEFVTDIDCMPLNPFENMPEWLGRQTSAVDKYFENHNEKKINGRAEELMKIFPRDNVNNADGISHLSPLANHASLLKQSKVQAKEADVHALSGLTRALDKKEAVVVELRRLNDDVFENQKDDDNSLKDSEPFKKHYAAVLLQLNEANEQVSSALYCLRQRNTYVPNASPRQGANSADPCDGFSLDHPSCLHVNEIMDSSRTNARVMVAAAVKAMSSLKDNDGTKEKIEEAIDYINDRLPSVDSSMHMSPDLKPGNVSDIEAQIPSDLISKCVASLLMMQKCTERQFPPSEVARVLDSALTSLHPRSSQNLSVYSDIQKCMGILRNQIMALIPT